jgi:argininosuccinate lyase
MEKFNESLWFDKRMWAQDIRGSVAYAKAIGKVGIITDEEVTLLIEGLEKVHKEWEAGTFEIKTGDEGRGLLCSNVLDRLRIYLFTENPDFVLLSCHD